MNERPLSHREREVLEEIVGAPGVKFREDYLAQVAVATVTKRSDCCPSIALSVPAFTVDRAPEESSPVEYPLQSEAYWRGPLGVLMDVIVFQRDGWLSYLEVVHNDDDDLSETELPPADQLILIDPA